MQRAIEEAGSVFTGWISSCLSCLDSSGNDERARHQQAPKDRGAEREMQICHSQPHLVPPMKLVVYDDLPSPGPPRASSFPTWMLEEGRNLASRASSRASMSFKRKSTAPVRISAPTDFRRVTTLPPISTASTGYRPLELSIHSPVNRLPELPRFSDFGVDEGQAQQAPIARPPRALSTMTDYSYPIRRHTHRPSSSFNLPRKPVGSGSRRSSLATLDLLTERQVQVPFAHPLIPHFSVRSSTASVATGLATTVYTSPRPWPNSLVASPPLSNNFPRRASHDVTTSTTNINNNHKPQTPQDKSLPPVPAQSGYESPSTPVATTGPAEPFASADHPPSRSSRVTQWLLQQSNTPKTPASTRPSTPRKRSLSISLSDKLSMRIRSRTLSGSTLAPSISSPPPGCGSSGSKTADTSTSTPPTTIATMTTATARTSTLDSRLALEKDLEASYSYPYPIYPFAPRQTQSSILSDEHVHSHPTIHEAQQQYSPNPNHAFDYPNYAYDHHRHSAIGVAF
ncbi:uncharacterized protein BDV17DRAFT_107142 [Aspergillus undulatus]|uniref:uncharacterized protein n=1 Tax=Aspergillus undulatus TaxID=1810928 RepID=UPI003CCCA276